MFATDADLLPFEPNLFRDVLWVTQRLVEGQATISGSILTMTTYDTALDTAGVDAGNVAFINSTSYEVLERLSATTARLSRPRSGPDAPQIPVPDVSTPAIARIATFAPQIGIVHTQLLRMLGIEPGQDASPTESDITNPDALTRVEALGALHLIFSAAGSLTDKDSPTNQRADFYRQRFAKERERVTAQIDLNADGHPDAIRKLNIHQLLRA